MGKLLRRSGLPSYRQYLDLVAEDRTGNTLVELIDALTTNHTNFLRETAHFDFLRDTLAPNLRAGAIEIWSAACSTGEEPYSILFTLLDKLGEFTRVRVTATDLSTRALRAVEEGAYESKRLETLPPQWLSRFFNRPSARTAGLWQVKPEYRAMVRCARVNLISGEMPAQTFPVIFCRNAMIYFDKPTQRNVVNRLLSKLEPGGYLFVGHAECLAGEHAIEYVRPAVYRKPGKGESWRNPRGF